MPSQPATTAHPAPGSPPLVATLLFGRRLTFPWVTLLLETGCVVATLPMFFDERLFLVTGADNPVLTWWHPIVTTFVHGGGPPGTAVHLFVNSLVLLLFGALLERLLGSARMFVLSAACWLSQWLVFSVAVPLRSNGISGVNWGYSLFAAAAITILLRRRTFRLFRDPFFWLAALFGLLHLVVTTVLGSLSLLSLLRGAPLTTYAHLAHSLALLTTVPFFFAWLPRCAAPSGPKSPTWSTALASARARTAGLPSSRRQRSFCSSRA